MNTYLAIITTVLVITQIIRLIQNIVSLTRQNKLIKKQLEGIADISQEDIETQKQAFRLLVKYINEQTCKKCVCYDCDSTELKRICGTCDNCREFEEENQPIKYCKYEER